MRRALPHGEKSVGDIVAIEQRRREELDERHIQPFAYTVDRRQRDGLAFDHRGYRGERHSARLRQRIRRHSAFSHNLFYS